MDNKNSRTDAEMYDVSTYTDLELYNLLDMNSPTDHELEARIIFLIRKYVNMQNESGDELAKFFTNIHKRFFDVSDDSEDEGEDEGEKPEPVPFKESKLANTIEHFQNRTIETTRTIEGMTSSIDANSIPPIQNSVPLASQVNGTTNSTASAGTSSVGYTKTLDFATGNLNPLLNQTIKRIISVDSQYRDNKKTLTSNFTFHLSEPLKDVVSMKLYSVQIPYTWYTISTGYGSNLIYLKGNSPGIDDGYHDYPITITPGNYGPSDLAGNINASISNLAATYKYDVSFATTSMNYKPGNSLNTFVVDITKQYNETSYDISFSGLTSPFFSSDKRIGSTSTSIPGFLGFANSIYSSHILNSNLLDSSTTTASVDSNQRVYQLTTSNNYFTVYKYIGPQENSSITTNIDISFNIKFSLETGKTYTRNELVNDISAQIFASDKLDSKYSYIKRLDISNTTLDPSMVGYKTNSVFQLSLKTNRINTNNIEYSKCKVVFQPDLPNVINTIWVGTNSCFGFKDLSGEINTLLSDTSPVGASTTNYIFPPTQTNPPQIYLACNKTGFDVSGNDYIIEIPTAPSMTLNSYLNAINTAIASPINVSSKSVINNEINTTFSKAQIDNSNNFNLQLDINKIINQTNYVISFEDTLVTTDPDSNTTTYTNPLPIQGNLSLTNNVFDISLNYADPFTFYQNTSLITIYSSSGSSHVKYTGTTTDVSYHIFAPVGQFSYSALQNALQNAITDYKDQDNSSILRASSVKVGTTTDGIVPVRITIVINKNISESDYSIQFRDFSGNGQVLKANNVDPTNSWYKYLFIDPSMIDQSYNLYNNYTKSSISGNVISSSQNGTSYISVNGYKPISQNTITLTSSNNYFDLIPTESGLTTATKLSQITNQTPQYYNTIRISIPYLDNNDSPIAYTRDNLLIALNNAFVSTDASGSQISVITNGGSEFTKMRITINKTFTAADYKVVFYDTASFVQCNVGSTSVINSTWDTTLGWILGFRIATTYLLVPEQVGYKGPISIVGDTGAVTNLYNYFLICLDDYNQNHLNDGLVTVTPRDTSIPLPTYANLSNFVCDPVTGKKVYNTAAVTDDKQLTQAQIYSLTQIANSQSPDANTNALSRFVSTKSFGQGPFVSDVFAIVPMKVAGLANGSNYVEFSGSLQNQQRTYFGPVNIVKMSVKLVNDRGDIVDLNNANWSFSIIVEMLYQQKPGASTK